MNTYAKLALIVLVFIATIDKDVVDGASSSSGSICGMTSNGLMSCKDWVGGPNSRPVSADCCAALSSCDFKCMCSFKNSKLLPALGIDPTSAMQLPVKCNLVNSFHC